MPLNLAKRPFVDTRPVNALTALLVLLVLGLSVVSWRTFRAYLADSHDTQAAIGELKKEIAAYDEERKGGEARLALYDVSDLGASAEDVNDIKRRREFSWTRFLTHLESTLPSHVRVVAVALARVDSDDALAAGGIPVELQLLSRDALGLPKTIRAFYDSPWFDMPVPVSDQGPEQGSPEGRTITLRVSYRDVGKARAGGVPADTLVVPGAKTPGGAR